MSVSDAITARGMSQRIKRAIPAIEQNFYKQHALLAIAQDRNLIDWNGSHTEFDWFVRKESGKKATFGGGELSIRTFEEVDPANKVSLPYCWIERTYGISDKTIEANRHASGRQKVYDSLKENLIIKQIELYDALASSLYGRVDKAGAGDDPVGLVAALGDPYAGSDKACTLANKKYAGKAIVGTSNITAWADKKASYADPQWAPEVINVNEVPGGAATPKWSTHCLVDLAFMADQMAVSHKVSGTGKPVKPDLALMASATYNALKGKLITAVGVGYNIPLGDQKLKIAGWSNIQVDTLLCVKDTEMVKDSTATALAMVIVLDTKAFRIATTHTKAEGLIINEFDTDNPLISGAIGVLKCNLQYRIASPTAIGAIIDCSD